MKLLVQILAGAVLGLFVPALLLMFMSKFSFIGLPLACSAMGAILLSAGYWIALKFKVDMSFEGRGN